MATRNRHKGTHSSSCHSNREIHTGLEHSLPAKAANLLFESSWLKEPSLGRAGILSARAPLRTGPNSALWAHPEQVWHPVSQGLLGDLKTETPGPRVFYPFAPALPEIKVSGSLPWLP